MMNSRHDTVDPRHAALRRVCVLVGLVIVFGLGGAARAQEPPAEPPAARPQLLAHDTSAAWRADAKRRSNSSIAIYLAREAAAAALLAWLAFSGTAARVRARLSTRLSRRFLLNAAAIAAVFTLLRLVSLPFDAARFYLARSYGVAHASVGSWLGDFGIQYAVNLASALFIGLLFYTLLRRRPATWWRWVMAAAMPFTIASVAITPLYMALFNTFTPLADRPLAAEILALAERSGVPADEVFVVDFSRRTRAANAFVTGVGPTATIALSDTLLEQFTEEEVLFVMAHEMGHYAHRHLWLGIVAAAILTAAGAFLLQRLLEAALARWRERLGIDSLADVASLPLVLLAVSLVGFVAQPVGASISRQIEIDADRFALELTVPADLPAEAAVSTFERLGRLGLSDPDPHPILRFLFWSHPTLDERIEFVGAPHDD